MSINEKKLWLAINQIQKIHKNWLVFRLESRTINGIPDVFCCCNGVVFWLELKSSNANNKGISKFQYNWHYDYFVSGGISFILNYHATQSTLQLLAIHEPRTIKQVLSVTMSRDPSKKDLEENINHIINHIIDQNT